MMLSKNYQMMSLCNDHYQQANLYYSNLRHVEDEMLKNNVSSTDQINTCLDLVKKIQTTSGDKSGKKE